MTKYLTSTITKSVTSALFILFAIFILTSTTASALGNDGDIGDPSYGGWGGHDGDYNDGNDPSLDFYVTERYVPPYTPPYVPPYIPPYTPPITPPTVDPAPTCTLTASPPNTVYGGNATLTWSSIYASSATMSDGIGAVGTAGSYSLSGLLADNSYTLTVSGEGGTSTCSAHISVAEQVVQTVPTCDVRVSPTVVDHNGQARLYWSSTNATSMYISGIGYVSSNTSGSQMFYNLTADKVFTCTARDYDGDEASDIARLTVRSSQSNIPPTCSLSAMPSSVPLGGDTTLSWSTTNAHSASLSNLGSVPVHGSRALYNMRSTKTYTLTVQGNGGTATCSRTVGVYTPYQPPIVPPTVVLPTCQIYPIYTTGGGGGAILNWTAQNAASAVLSEHGPVSRVSGTQFVKPTSSKTYTLTVFNNGYRASCSTHLTVAAQTIVHYTTSEKVNLGSVPYTGAMDYVYFIVLPLIVLLIGTGVFIRTRNFF